MAVVVTLTVHDRVALIALCDGDRSRMKHTFFFPNRLHVDGRRLLQQTRVVFYDIVNTASE